MIVKIVMNVNVVKRWSKVNILTQEFHLSTPDLIM